MSSWLAVILDCNPVFQIEESTCQLDEQWFDLTKDTLRDALQITPVNDNQSFTSPPSSDALINFVNELGKTSGFERPRAPVLQILWGRKHKFHPRPDSLLHLPNEEPVFGYLKFSAKGTKREVFGMPIPDSLITAANRIEGLGQLGLGYRVTLGVGEVVWYYSDGVRCTVANIQEASYYQEYLAKVAEHQRYLAGETGSDPNSPIPKPTKTARKPKPTTPKAPPRPSVSKPVSSTQPEPKSAPAKTQRRKRKLTTEISDKPSKAIKSKHGFEPRVDDEEADVQRALEESMKSMYDVPRGPLPPVVIREPESEKYQPLSEVPRKGKAKDLIKMKAAALKEQTPASRPIKALMVYPPNTPVTLVPMKFFIATNFELTVSRFTEMHDAHTVVRARCLKLKAELSIFTDKIQKDDHNELVKHFSNLKCYTTPSRYRNNREVHLYYLKHLKESVATVREIVEEAWAVVQIILWNLDSGCSKHMTGDRSRLRNFVKNFIGTVRFGNDHFGAIMGYEDYMIGDSVISRVYYVEGLRHNHFFVRQFCDSDLEVAFRKHSCYVRDTDGVELIKGSRG
nr:integrase, catalytic region, zinc finger, CCHC-type, peptidase aspartic, catalytic [Tanacetum cinerariifolium]